MATAMLEDYQERTLYDDELDIIFSLLTVKTLCNVAQVSRSWNHAAKRQMAKRGLLRRVLLPVLYNNEESVQLDFSNYFPVKPNTLIMFCGPRPSLRPVLSLEYTIMEEYHKRLRGRIIMLGVDQVIMDTQEVRSCQLQSLWMSETPVQMTLDHIIGLSLPDFDGFTIKVAECVSHEKNTERKAEKIFQELHDAAENLENPIFLLFSRYAYTIGSHVLRKFHQKYANKTINIWGSTISDFIKRSDDGYPDYRGTHGFLGILLQSDRLQAHSLVLPIDQDDDTMSTRLADFRASFKLRRHSLGLVCGPRQFMRRDKRYYANDFMKMLKHQFPTIDFTGMFNDPSFYYFGCDHMNKNGDYSLQHKGAMSIMILTFD